MLGASLKILACKHGALRALLTLQVLVQELKQLERVHHAAAQQLVHVELLWGTGEGVQSRRVAVGGWGGRAEVCTAARWPAAARAVHACLRMCAMCARMRMWDAGAPSGDRQRASAWARTLVILSALNPACSSL